MKVHGLVEEPDRHNYHSELVSQQRYILQAQRRERLIGVEDVEEQEDSKELTVDLGFRILLLIANIYRVLAMCQTLHLVTLLHLILTRAL